MVGLLGSRGDWWKTAFTAVNVCAAGLVLLVIPLYCHEVERRVKVGVDGGLVVEDVLYLTQRVNGQSGRRRGKLGINELCDAEPGHRV